MFADGRNRFDRTVEGKAPAEALAAYIDFYLSESHRDRRDRGCPLPALSGDLARLDLAARETFEQGVGRLTGALAERLAALGRTDPDGLATSMLSEMVGALLLARSIADPTRSDGILDASRRGLKTRLGLNT